MKKNHGIIAVVRCIGLAGIIALGLATIIGSTIGGDGGNGGGTKDNGSAVTCTDADGDGYSVGSGCGATGADTDGDGTSDSADACPDDAGKVEPGSCGCGEADLAGCPGTNITIGDRSGDIGDTVTFTIEVHNALKDVHAFGFDLYYDKSVLQYQSHAWGGLVEGTDWIIALNPDLAGGMRAGGINPAGAFTAGSSGTLLTITFTVVGCGVSQMNLTALVDDMKDYAARDGLFTCLEGDEQDCDDADADVNPGAAESCDGIDNNCNGAVDEGCAGCADADGDGYFSGCGATGVDTDGDGAPDSTDACPDDAGKVEPGLCGCGEEDQAGCPAYTISIDDRSGRVGDTVTFTIEVHNALEDVNAFGVDLYYDKSVLQYQSHAWGELLPRGWTLGLNPKLPDRLVMGGMNPFSKFKAGASGTLVTITFTVLKCGDSRMDLAELEDNMRRYIERDGLFTCLETPVQDCDDGDTGAYPGAVEVLDGLDNDCDGSVDEGVGPACTDADNDGYFAQTGCGATPDCNDANAAVNAGAAEVCRDGIDNNCNGQVDENCPACTDADGDGYFVQADCGTMRDCDDANAGVHPGAAEVCEDGLDQDCDGIDQPCQTYYRDADADGYGNPSVTIEALIRPDGYATDSTDCDDADAGVHPGEAEVCEDGLDQDCDGVDPACLTFYRDADADGYGNPAVTIEGLTCPGGYAADNTDCDDAEAAANPGAAEFCDDAIDNDCDGTVNEDCATCIDADDDGYCSTEDCDDSNAGVNPGATEVCEDGIDQDCDGIDQPCLTFYRDTDSDGYGSPDVTIESGTCPAGYVADNTDCDDADSGANPGEEEVCDDGIDNDCDDFTDEKCPVVPTSKVPDSGQTTCYNASGTVISPCPSPGGSFYGQDACYTINPPSYTKLDGSGNALPDGAASWAMIMDNVTGLIWENKTNDGTIHDWDNEYTWSNATSVFIAQLNAAHFGGYSDWRLPTVNELSWIADHGNYSPAIDTFYFSNTKSEDGFYWTNTENAANTVDAWKVFFWIGYSGVCYVGECDKMDSYYVRAVSGGQSSSSFVDNGDGTITDRTTGLIWAKYTADMNADGAINDNDKVNWSTALTYCENSTLAGYSDWRLPTLKELSSIVDYTRTNPAINTTFFPDTVSADDEYDGYYTGTTHTGSHVNAMRVDFSIGRQYGYNKSSGLYHVRPVRGGQ